MSSESESKMKFYHDDIYTSFIVAVKVVLNIYLIVCI